MIEQYEKYIILILSILAISISIAVYILYNYEIIPENSIYYENYHSIVA